MLPQRPSFVRAHPSKRCSRKANLSDSEAVIRPSIPAPMRRPHFPTPSPLVTNSNVTNLSRNPNFQYPQTQQQLTPSRLPISVPPPRVPIQPMKSEVIYESVSSSHQSSNSHIYEMIGSERSAVAARAPRGEKPKVPPRNSSTGLTKVSKKVRIPVVAPSNQVRTKPESNNVHFLHQQQQQKQDNNALSQKAITMPNVLQPNVLKYFQQKLYQSFGTGVDDGMQDGKEMFFQYNNNNNGPSNIFGDLNPISEVPGDNGMTVVKQQQIDMMLETAQFLATAAYLERAAQKVASSKSRTMDMNAGGYCGALQRAPPPVPPALARRLANRENLGFGKVKVMLRISDNPPEDPDIVNYLSVDKKKRQVTLTDPSTNMGAQTNVGAQERGPMVSAPKIFAFDSLFTAEDNQIDVCSSALSEVIPAVLEGSDGCLLALGYPGAGQTKTMMGSTADLGAIPCAIAWLYKGINEKRQKTGSRFSVRVSALGVNATKPGSSARDLLAAHATESDESPGVYLRDDFLGGPTELRAPTAERAALFLDAALVGRGQSPYDPALIFTLHVYQYSLAGKGGVAGGRSRLHLIDLGGCSNRSGGLPLSGVGNVLLSILSGQRHPPNRDHPLTPLLKDCLAPLTCHVAIIAHVAHSQTHTDTLTTIQLATRIHRMRRRKHRNLPFASGKNLDVNGGHQSGTGSSEGPDPSSSDLSADTVIYVGPGCEETDGEHPPVYLPSLNSGDNRGVMSKALRGSMAEKLNKSPMKKLNPPKSHSPVLNQHRTESPKRHLSQRSNSCLDSPQQFSRSIKQNPNLGVSKASNIPTPKGSPMKRAQQLQQQQQQQFLTPEMVQLIHSQEQWIDGPRVSRSKVAEARHMLREINHVKNNETWIDGPKTASPPTAPLMQGGLPNPASSTGYGFMDSHKKSMIRQWVENQSSQLMLPNQTQITIQQQRQIITALQQGFSGSQVMAAVTSMTSVNSRNMMGLNDDLASVHARSCDELVNPLLTRGFSNLQGGPASSESAIRTGLKQMVDQHSNTNSIHDGLSDKSVGPTKDGQEEEDQDSGPSEVPPALPLMEPLGSREISHESLMEIVSRHMSRESLAMSQQNVEVIDCGLQVTEEDILRTMGSDHPLSALSHGDMSVVSSLNHGDAFSECVLGNVARRQFDDLARLRELFTSQLEMAEVTPSFRLNDAGSIYSEPPYKYTAGAASVCSEPAYRPPSQASNRCRDCHNNLSRTPSQSSLPSLNGIVAIACMEQYASLRHPDGASDPNLQKIESKIDETLNRHVVENPLADIDEKLMLQHFKAPKSPTLLQKLPLLPVSTPETYDSEQDSTPRTSKHSEISRRAESGYHSVGTVRDSDGSSFGSGAGKAIPELPSIKDSPSKQSSRSRKQKQDKSLCTWLRNPFTCTEGEISDF